MAGRYKLTHPLEITRQVTKKPTESVVAEDDNAASGTAEPISGGDVIHERPILVPTKDKEVMQAIGLLRQYLRDTGVNVNMKKFTTALLRSNILPYNPYPGYVRRFSTICENFHTSRETLQEIQRRVSSCPTFVTGSGILSGVKLPNVKLWGLQHILIAINPKILSIYRKFVTSATMPSATMNAKLGSGLSVITTMKGPCIFSGSVTGNCFKLNIGVSIVATASDFSNAARMFGKAVLLDLAHISKDSSHHLLSLQMPVADGAVLKRKVLSSDELELLLSVEVSPEKDALIEAIGFSALKKHDCIVNLLMTCGEDADVLKMNYIRAVKSYNLMILLKEGLQGQAENTLYISTAPYQALHEGIFIEQTEAELYLSLYKKHSVTKSPLMQSVTTAVQKVWQEKIAGRQLESDLVLISHYLWLMERIQNQTKPTSSKGEGSLAIELCRILQCLGVKLEAIGTLLTVLYDITQHKLGISAPEVYSNTFLLFKTHLSEFFNEESHELAVSFAKPVVLRVLSEIESSKDFNHTRALLNVLKGYAKSLSVCLISAALGDFTAIRNTQAQIDGVLQTEFGKNLNIEVRSDAFRHRSETSTYVDVDRKQVDMSVSSVTIAAPSQISHYAARMQYCMDIWIDQVWKEFMWNIFIVRLNLPPNPYPCLIRLLRQASLKVQLYREDNASILRKLFAAKPRLHNDSLGLYMVPGISAFGVLGTVSALGVTGFKQVNAMASTVAIIPAQSSSAGSPPISAGAFEIKCLMAIANETLFFGNVSSYLASISTHEYCFIKGPKAQEHDGVLAFGKILIIYLGNLQTQGILTVRATFADAEIELYDLNNAASRFQNQMSSLISTRQPVVLHLLMPLEWRYVYVTKTIHVCHVNEMSDDAKFITEHDLTAPYHQVFCNANDATEYMKRIRIFKNSRSNFLEQEAAKDLKKYDWPSFAQLTLSVCLKNKSVESMEKDMIETATFSWRLFQSPYGALHYSIGLNAALCEALKYLDGTAAGAGEVQNRLTTMLFGYRNCLNSVLTSQSTMASSALNPYCQDLLQNCAPCDLATGTANLANADGLVATLTHIRSLTQAIADSIAADLVNCMPVLKTTFK